MFWHVKIVNRKPSMNATPVRYRIKFSHLVIVAGIMLSSCAAPSDPSGAKPTERSLLTPRAVVTGARVSTLANPVFGAVPPLLPNAYLQWMSPTQVVARNSFMYVVDNGRRRIYRYDSMRQTMAPFADYAASSVRAIAVAGDLSLYVLDGAARQVLHFAVDGRLLRRFGNELEVARPVGMLFDDATGQILVADSLYNHVVFFNSFGHIVAAIKPAAARSIEAMAQGPDGLYLLDRTGRQVVVVGRDGQHRYTFGKDLLVHPQAIAVDRYNRVFVSDSFDNTIRIFEQEKMVASLGGTGTIPASFNQVSSLWLEQDMLYVADSLNGRVQTFQVAPPGRRGALHD